MIPKRKTTSEDFIIYQNEVIRLIDKFGIDDWKIYFEQRDCDESQAELVTDCVNRVCTFVLANEFTEGESVENSAFHEVCHLLVGDLTDLNYYRWVTQNEVIKASETTARKLQSILKELI